MDTQAMSKELEKLKQEVSLIKQRRIYQEDITPTSVKTRHIGEGVPYLLTGLAANRPTAGYLVTQGASVYWAYDTHVLSIWDNSQWRTVTLA